MKKNLLLFIALAASFGMMAQNVLHKTDRSFAAEKFSKNYSSTNLANPVSSGSSSSAKIKSIKENTIDPDFIKDKAISALWNTEEERLLYFNAEFDIKTINSYTNEAISLTVNYLDDNFESTGETAFISFPEHTKYATLVGECSSDHILIFLQYFPNDGGPEDRHPELWIAKRDGTVVKKVTYPEMYTFYAGKLLVIRTESVDAPEATLHIMNGKTFQDENTIEVPDFSLQGGMAAGSFMLIEEVDGKDCVIFNYFKIPFYDNSTWAYTTEGNSLIMDFYDIETGGKVKQIESPLSNFVDLFNLGEIEGEPGFGVIEVEVAMFPHDKWSFSKNLFNDDDKLEITLGVNYERFLSPSGKFIYYYVINEDGDVLKKLERNFMPGEDYIIPLNDLEGENDLVVFVESDEERNQSLVVFDVNNWADAAKIPAMLNDYQLSLNICRIATADSYEYLIQTGNMTADELDRRTGYIAKVNKSGELIEALSLQLGEKAYRFSPYFSSNYLGTKIFNDDDDLEFYYQVTISGSTSPAFYISKANESPIYSFASNDTYGALVSAGGLYSPDGKTMTHLSYGYENGNIYYYALPFKSNTSVKNEKMEERVIYYDDASKTINVDIEDIVSIEVYSISGAKVLNASSSVVSAANLSKGVYIVKAISASEGSKTQKILIH